MFGKKPEQDEDITSLITGGKVRSKPATAPQQQPTAQSNPFPQQQKQESDPAAPAKAALERILNRSVRFTNLKLYKTIENVQKVSAIGIPATEFDPNKDETANFNFIAQFAALADELARFEKSFSPHNLDDEKDQQATNFIYWLAAGLFKLNLHIASDPLAVFQGQDAERIQDMFGKLLGVMEADQNAVAVLSNAFNSLRAISAKTYGAWLEQADPYKVVQGQIIQFKDDLEQFGDYAEIVAPAFAIALGYTQVLFRVGTTKDLHDQVKVQFPVERGEQGYKLRTLAGGFAKRFSKYAGAYAQWHVLTDGKTVTKVDEIGEFRPNEKILLEIDNSFISVGVPESNWEIHSIKRQNAFFDAVARYGQSQNYQSTLVLFPFL